MVNVLTNSQSWETLVRDQVHKLTVSQFIGIKSQWCNG